MAHRVLMSVLVGVVIVGFVSLWATPAATQTAVPRTSWGDPDISGIFTTDAEQPVPFERPEEFFERRLLTEEELARRAGQADARIRDEKEDRSGAGALLGTPAHWFEVGNGVSARTSFVVDPADGRIPALTAEAAGMAYDPRVETGLMTGEQPELLGPEDTGLASRCLTRGIPQTWVPSIYNNGFQIAQTPDYVLIWYERYQEVRLIPLDGRPPLDPRIRQWKGDSRGRWEGDSLVIDVTNFSDKARFKGSGETLHVVERLTRVDAIYPSGIRQTLSCAGYNHNWVRVYVYEDDVAPLLPAGTILQVIGWYDNSAKNPRNPEPRNWKGFGNRSIDDMMFDLGKYIALTEEEFQAEVAARQAKRSKSTNN